MSVAKKSAKLLSQLYESVLQQKFKDIVVIKTKLDKGPRYLLIASSFSSKHLIRGTEVINQTYKYSIKENHDEYAQLGIAQDWNVLDYKLVVIHLFEPKCRQKYDLEQLWAVGEEYDDCCDSQPVPQFKYYLDKLLAERQNK